MAKVASTDVGQLRCLKEFRKLVLLQDPYMGEPAERGAVNLQKQQAKAEPLANGAEAAAAATDQF